MANVKKGNAINVQQTAPKFDTAQFSANVEQYNQEQARKQQGAAQFASQYGPTTGPYLPEIRQSTAASTNPIKSGNANSAYQVETISSGGGNNYYFPNGQLTTQGQQNALNGSGHVAGLPQGPQMGIDYSQFQSVGMYTPEQAPAEQVATPTQQAPKTAVGGTKQPSVSTPQNTVPQVAEENKTSEDYGILPAQQQEKPANNMNEQALADMQADLGGDNTGMLYGKVTADANGGNGIQTVADPYNVEKATNEARIANLRKLQTMSSEDIATSITGGYTPYGDQAMRDLMQYNPEKYAEVQQFIKQQKGQNSINSITTGDVSGMNTTQTAVDNVNNGVDSWADGLSSSPQQAGQLVTNISSTMANNGVATTATQEMLNLNAQMADIQEKMANVKKEAQKAFKGDVPQYIVDAYANNRLQEYQSQYNKLESRYNAAMDLYKTELDNAKRQAEMDLKRAQFQQNKSDSEWDRYYKMQQLQQDSIKRVNGTAYKLDAATGTYRQLSDESAKYSYTNKVNEMMKGWSSIYQDGDWYGAQCEAFTDNFVQATTGQRMTGQRSDGATTAEEKRSYVNTLTPEVGSVVVAIGGAYDSQRGHTMLITGYDPTTGLIDLTWANTNGDLKIHKSTTTLADIQRNAQRVGIRNPYDDIVNSSQVQGGTGTYSYYSNAMQSFFEEAYENATVASERADIQAAQDSYAIMNELVETGTIDKLANSDEFNVLLSEISNGKFSDGGNINFGRITEYARNVLKDEEIAYGIDRFHRLIEKKLRKESGAAISQSEWNSNFDMYLPQVGQTPEYRYKSLAALERDIVAAQLPPKYRANYIPVVGSSTKREIR